MIQKLPIQKAAKSAGMDDVSNFTKAGQAKIARQGNYWTGNKKVKKITTAPLSKRVPAKRMSRITHKKM